jgi:hypothetical protein
MAGASPQCADLAAAVRLAVSMWVGGVVRREVKAPRPAARSRSSVAANPTPVVLASVLEVKQPHGFVAEAIRDGQPEERLDVEKL